MAGILFEDIFDVKDIDPDGKKFDRGMWTVTVKTQKRSSPVDSFSCKSHNYNCILHFCSYCVKCD